jgi:sugar transferase (PEP-CTERM/EpsH1 system associated)
MDSILFLCHRLPWPPDTGDKIRSYHVLQRLVRDYRVYLGTFVDKPSDWRHVAKVEEVCAGVCIRPLRPWRKRWRALASLARREALTVGIYRDPVMRRWVDGLVADHKIDRALCCSSGVAPMVVRHTGLPRVMDFVDVDSDKWRQYARAHTGLARMIYRREGRRLAGFERAVAARFDASVFVSEYEAAFFRKQAPESAGKIHGIPNGVDTDYWDPQRDYWNPYRPVERTVVFVGAMDYRANVHAAEWFAGEVWPRIVSRQPAARFYIVGNKPTPAVRALGERDGITVTGRVDDVRPYVKHAHAVAAPLRIARGIQNKVLEALAMEKVVLATPEAWEGIDDFEGRQGCIDRSSEVLAEEALRWLSAPTPVRVAAARAMVQSRHQWARNLDAYEGLLRSARPASVTSLGMVSAAGWGAKP